MVSCCTDISYEDLFFIVGVNDCFNADLSNILAENILFLSLIKANKTNRHTVPQRIEK